MQHVKTSDLYALIGIKEVELAALKGQLLQAQADNKKLRDELDGAKPKVAEPGPNAPPMPAG